jgi:ABC-type lipoprotein release transport system permease subunit
MVAVCGVVTATLAAVCTLSVFNGFHGFASDMFSAFDPELKITPATGKVFDPTTAPFLEIRNLPEIDLIAESLEENVLVSYQGKQVPVMLKGVSESFNQLANVQKLLIDGEWKLHENSSNFALLSIGVANMLGVQAGFVYPMELYAPKRNAPVNLSNPAAAFNLNYAYIGGVFMVNQPVYDDSYMLVSLDLIREILDYSTEVGAWEIKLKSPAQIASVQKKIQHLLGDNYWVKDRYQQQESAFQMINIEKWVSFLMLCFILLIAVFNIIGSLSMLIVDKQHDITTLRHLGADNATISRIFLLEGWMITVLGGLIGIILGILLCLGQQYFGWIQLGTEGTFAVNAYPVQIEMQDLLVIFAAVVVIGYLSVQYPVRYLSKKWL